MNYFQQQDKKLKEKLPSMNIQLSDAQFFGKNFLVKR